MNDILYALIVLLQFYDLALTVRALDAGARELGPVKYLFALFTPVGALCATKAGLIGFLGWIRYEHGLPLWAHALIVVGYAWLALWNEKQVLTQERK